MGDALSREQIAGRLGACPGWRHRGNAIERTFECGDFDGSMRFVNVVAGLANAHNHHPDITIAWGSVTLTLTTHDAGGLTERDFGLATQIDDVAHKG